METLPILDISAIDPVLMTKLSLMVGGRRMDEAVIVDLRAAIQKERGTADEKRYLALSIYTHLFQLIPPEDAAAGTYLGELSGQLFCDVMFYEADTLWETLSGIRSTCASRGIMSGAQLVSLCEQAEAARPLGTVFSYAYYRIALNRILSGTFAEHVTLAENIVARINQMDPVEIERGNCALSQIWR